jgi:Bacteriocin-protection, YdeI or OmpD-Associated
VNLPARKSEPRGEVAMPAAFAERLVADPAVRAVFDAKSASFRKEYNIWIGEAKTDAARGKRIDEAMEWIAEGRAGSGNTRRSECVRGGEFRINRPVSGKAARQVVTGRSSLDVQLQSGRVRRVSLASPLLTRKDMRRC